MINKLLLDEAANFCQWRAQDGCALTDNVLQ